MGCRTIEGSPNQQVLHCSSVYLADRHLEESYKNQLPIMVTRSTSSHATNVESGVSSDSKTWKITWKETLY